MNPAMNKAQVRGQDGLQIVKDAPMASDSIAHVGVDSEMLLAGEALFLKREVVAPSTAAKRHYHSTASIIVILEGKVRVNYGSGFQYADYAEAGEFIFIPALMPHQPVNEDPGAALVCLVIRNAPWDEVLPYEPSEEPPTF